MTHEEFLVKYVAPFGGVEHIFDERGYSAWRMGTGENYEWLHFRLNEGQSSEFIFDMFSEMLERMKQRPPFHSVFAFTRESNRRAIAMHKFLGFKVQHVDGVYRDGSAMLSWQAFDKLCKFHCVHKANQTDGAP